MLESLISKIGLPTLINILSQALGSVDHPISKTASEALSQFDQELKAGRISQEQLVEANRHAEEIAKLKSKDLQKSMMETNKSLRTELASSDKYVRRMRPTFGYMMALTWAAQMFGIAYVIIFKTAQAGVVMAAMGSLSAIWAMGLSVLGIYVYKRSEDKKIGPEKEIIFWSDKK